MAQDTLPAMRLGDPVEVLLARCRAGDDDAWAELVERFGRLVHAVPVREGLRPHDAADVVQETFLQLLEHLDTITSPDRLPWWLMTVARRLSWKRRHAGRRDDALDPLALPAEEEPIDDAYVDAAFVHEAVGRLGSPCRELLQLLFLDPGEPSYAQVSRMLDMPVGSIGSCRATCLQRLRRLVDATVAS